MKKILTGLIFLVPFIVQAQLNGSLQVRGRIVNERGDGLPAVSVVVKGSSKGTSTDSSGDFSLVVNQKFPFALVITSVGYGSQEVEVRNPNSKLSIQLSTQSYLANEIVVTLRRLGVSVVNMEEGSLRCEPNASE